MFYFFFALCEKEVEIIFSGCAGCDSFEADFKLFDVSVIILSKNFSFFIAIFAN